MPFNANNVPTNANLMAQILAARPQSARVEAQMLRAPDLVQGTTESHITKETPTPLSNMLGEIAKIPIQAAFKQSEQKTDWESPQARHQRALTSRDYIGELSPEKREAATAAWVNEFGKDFDYLMPGGQYAPTINSQLNALNLEKANQLTPEQQMLMFGKIQNDPSLSELDRELMLGLYAPKLMEGLRYKREKDYERTLEERRLAIQEEGLSINRVNAERQKQYYDNSLGLAREEFNWKVEQAKKAVTPQEQARLTAQATAEFENDRSFLATDNTNVTSYKTAVGNDQDSTLAYTSLVNSTIDNAISREQVNKQSALLDNRIKTAVDGIVVAALNVSNKKKSSVLTPNGGSLVTSPMEALGLLTRIQKLNETTGYKYADYEDLLQTSLELLGLVQRTPPAPDVLPSDKQFTNPMPAPSTPLSTKTYPDGIQVRRGPVADSINLPTRFQ